MGAVQSHRLPTAAATESRLQLTRQTFELHYAVDGLLGMASNSETNDSVCGVCLDHFHDARVLPCLHSLCKTCIDELSVTATDGQISCPICRASVRLPAGGAANLPKDECAVGLKSDAGISVECASCHAETTKRKSTAWCKKCDLAFCESHALPHLLSSGSGEHVMIALPLNERPTSQSSAAHDIPMCPHHGDQMKFYCVACDVTICGDCAAIGEHKHHEPVKYVKDHVEEKMAEVDDKVDALEKEAVGKLERTIVIVDNVSTQLTKRAGEVRSEIKHAGERTKEMVDAHVGQMIQEVDDSEEGRHKVLGHQRDELKSHLEAVKNVVRFRKKMRSVKSVTHETRFPLELLQALDRRTTNLLTTQIEEQPQHHSRLLFQGASDVDTDFACKVREGIGKVFYSLPSAKKSVIEGHTSMAMKTGTENTVTIQVKDSDGMALTMGGDDISVKCASANAPVTAVTDHGDGSYTVSITCTSDGRYELQIFINGKQMSTKLLVKSASYTHAFDPDERHAAVTISGNRQKASVNGSTHRWYSVLGSRPMSRGLHTWKVKASCDHFSSYHFMLGIAPKVSPSSHQNDFHSVAHCWDVKYNSAYKFGSTTMCWSKAKLKCANNDTFEFQLNCDKRQLTVTNVRTRKSDTMYCLPQQEYFQYVSMLDHNKVTLMVEYVE